MNYKLKYSKQAIKFFKKHHQEKDKFNKAFKDMTLNYEKALNFYDIKQMKGTIEEIYRLRLGKYRAIYKLYNDVLIIFVLEVNTRGDIYKKY